MQASKSVLAYVTLTFEFLTHKGDRFILLLSRRPLPIAIKIVSFAFKILRSQVW